MTQLLAPLPPHPPSVGRARRLVSDALAEAGQEELADTVLLLTSEVVTNAVLHARTALELQVRVEGDVVHVSVADGSPVLPAPRDYDAEASTGRGLGLVAQLACAHGAERVDGNGKIVWFEVRADVEGEATELDAEALLEEWGLDDVDAGPPCDAPTWTDVRLIGVPVHLYRAMRQHNEALLREHALMGGLDDQPASAQLDLAHSDEVAREATESGVTSVDVTLPVPPGADAGARALLDALGRADERAAAGGMLTPAALPEVRWCRVWHLEEIARQVHGGEPTPWSPIDVQHRDSDTRLHVDPVRVLDALGHAVVVGDEENRIVFANRNAGRLLGWEGDELVGKRLTVLVPERLREQHLAGYTRMLVSGGSGRILGRPVVVPARCRDGSEVEVELLIESVTSVTGRPAFVACLRELGRAGDPTSSG